LLKSANYGKSAVTGVTLTISKKLSSIGTSERPVASGGIAWLKLQVVLHANRTLDNRPSPPKKIGSDVFCRFCHQVSPDPSQNIFFPKTILQYININKSTSPQYSELFSLSPKTRKALRRSSSWTTTLTNLRDPAVFVRQAGNL